MTVEPSLTLLLGINGAGKSSILQVFAFARNLAEGTPQLFFDDRGWSPKDMRFRSPSNRSAIIDLKAIFSAPPWGKLRWSVRWGTNSGMLRSERLQLRRTRRETPIDLFTFDRRKGGRVGKQDLPALQFKGSVLSLVQEQGRDETVERVTSDLYSWLTRIQSLELLSPLAMKGGTRVSAEDMGPRGERLAGFLAALRPNQRTRVTRRVNLFYPLAHLDTVRKRAGWIDLILAERFSDLSTIASTQMSDGFMRLLALCAIPELPAVSMILLDEVEDGIEPHILGRLVSLVAAETRAQIVATSHSPILANAIGQEGLRLVSRTHAGRTLAVEVDEMPAFRVGTEYFGPGELWTNTDLRVLEEEALRAAAHDADAPEMDEL